MMLRKRFACLLALLVAAMTASAADWFTTTIAATPTATGGSWTPPTGGGWVFDTSYGTLNNPTQELVFAATEAKTLPGNVATISTTVKFTAFDASDAPTNEVPSGAKGGLTIVENLDVNPPTTNFFGIVGNVWVQLVPNSGDTTAALSSQVPVVVTVSKNGDTNYIEYTVNNVALKYGGVSKIPTANVSLAGDPDIQSVSYKGVCELAALSGTASASVFELTVPTIANATVSVTAGNAVIPPKSQGKYDITSGTGNVVITYTAAQGYMLNRAGTMQLAGLLGDTDVTAAEEFAGLESNLIVAQIGETTYTKLQAAITAATSNQTVTLIVNDIEDVSTANPYAFTLDLNAKTLTGNVTIASGAGRVTIQNGTIAGNLAANNEAGVAIEGENAVYVSGTFTGTATIAAPGGYNAAVADIQAICSVGYFAKENDGGTYTCLVEKGVAVTPTGTGVTMQVDPAAIPVGVNAADYFADNGQNGKPRWVNYAVGLEPDSAATIGVAEVSSTENTVTIGTDTTVNDASGVPVVVKSGDTELENGALPLAAGTYNITIEVGGVSVASKEVGVAASAAATAAEKADVKIVKVPYSRQINGQPMTVDALLNKANLAVGDKVWAYNTTADNYVEWTLTADGAWSGSPSASTYQVVAGQGLWLKTTAETGFFQCGAVEVGQQITLVANEWNLLALNGNLATSAIGGTGATVGDKIRVESSTSMVPTEYEYTSDGWTKKTITIRTTATGRKIQTVTWEPTSTITNGDSGVWYITVAGSTPTITL